MKKSFILRFFAVVLIALLFSQVALPTYSVYAGRSGQSFQDDIEFVEPEEEEAPAKTEKPGFIEKFLCEFFTDIGIQLENLLSIAGISLDSVIYGRGAGSGVALFTFELEAGNPYGLVGASLYKIFRSISFAAIGVIAVSKLSVHSFLRMTPQNLDKSKAALAHLVLTFLLLALTPYLVDVALNLRDALVRMVVSTASSYLGVSSGSVGLIDLLREEAGDRIIGGVVYIAAIVYTLYLAFLYAGYAMSFLVCFAAFPLVAIASGFKQDLLKNWMSTVSYYVLVPVIDGALLLIPAYMVRSGISGIVVLFSCMCMTQARGILAQLLGVQDRGSGMMGFAAMMAAGKLVGSAVQTGKAAIGQLSGAKSDASMAKYEDEMASASGESLSAQEAGIESNTSQHGASGIDGARGFVSDSGSSKSTVATSSSNISDVNTSASNSAKAGTGETIYSSGSTATNEAIYDGASASTNASNGDNTNAESASISFTSDLGNRRTSETNYSDIANKYATVGNFESGPLNNQISHTKKAELYRQRAKQRRKQAVGTLAGGAVGGLVGASAGLMLGPAATGMGASVGIDAGSQIGSAIAPHVPITPSEFKDAGVKVSKTVTELPDKIGRAGRKIGEIAASLGTSATTHFSSSATGQNASLYALQNAVSMVEKVAGEVIDIPESPTDIALTDEVSIGNKDWSIPLGINSVNQENVNTHMTSNARPIMDSCRRLNDYYTDNAQAVMEPLYKEMKANNDFDDMSKDAARELFRDRIHSQYMSEFNQLYDNHAERVVSDDALLEQSSKEAIAARIRSGYFNKNNSASFVSDEALDSYSWFDL